MNIYSILFRLKRWWLANIGSIEHEQVLVQALEDGAFSYKYAFMVVIGAGIATIGLLLNSPAVIIGAMLISPLMGPIVLGGMAITTTSYRRASVAFFALAAGVVLAFLVAYVITALSPLYDLTPEILARTRPNLFDLIVAMLSGLAGGYATIRGRGGAIVGVAIATALMPPIAVVGIGTALRQGPIAQGALLLFLTNMAAIAIAVAFVATWFGFGRHALRHALAWQTILAAAILLPLAVPLGLSLKTIGRQTVATQAARQALERALGKPDDWSIASFRTTFPTKQSLAVDAVVVTTSFHRNLASATQAELESKLKLAAHVNVQQILGTGDIPAKASALANPLVQTQSLQPDWTKTIRQAFPLATRLLDVDPQTRSVRILPEPDQSVDLHGFRLMERRLREQFPGWQVTLIPPFQALPLLYFPANSIEMNPAASGRLNDIVWALHAWQIKSVELTGFASTTGAARRNRALAADRAREVARVLEGASIHASWQVIYPAPGQRQEERQDGYASWRRVTITFASPPRQPLP